MIVGLVEFNQVFMHSEVEEEIVLLMYPDTSCEMLLRVGASGLFVP